VRFDFDRDEALATVRALTKQAAAPAIGGLAAGPRVAPTPVALPGGAQTVGGSMSPGMQQLAATNARGKNFIRPTPRRPGAAMAFKKPAGTPSLTTGLAPSMKQPSLSNKTVTASARSLHKLANPWQAIARMLAPAGRVTASEAAPALSRWQKMWNPAQVERAAQTQRAVASRTPVALPVPQRVRPGSSPRPRGPAPRKPIPVQPAPRDLVDPPAPQGGAFTHLYKVDGPQGKRTIWKAGFGPKLGPGEKATKIPYHQTGTERYGGLKGGLFNALMHVPRGAASGGRWGAAGAIGAQQFAPGQIPTTLGLSAPAADVGLGAGALAALMKSGPAGMIAATAGLGHKAIGRGAASGQRLWAGSRAANLPWQRAILASGRARGQRFKARPLVREGERRTPQRLAKEKLDAGLGRSQ
jgi:hypothetical protein